MIGICTRCHCIYIQLMRGVGLFDSCSWCTYAIQVGMKWVTSLVWPTCNQTILLAPLTLLSCFFITSTISGVLSRNVSFRYSNPTNGGYWKTTGTSTKSQKPDQSFSCPYHWPRQCGEDNHPPASLQYNRTAESFQSEWSWGIPCSRCHYLSLLMWIDWLVWAQSNCTGNVDLQSLLIFTEAVAERGAWYWEWNDIWE